MDQHPRLVGRGPRQNLDVRPFAIVGDNALLFGVAGLSAIGRHVAAWSGARCPRPGPAASGAGSPPAGAGSSPSPRVAGYRTWEASRRDAEVAMVCAFLARFLAGAALSSSGWLPPHLLHSRGLFGSADA